MSFSTKSYLAGVGSVVAALTVGFSGGFFMAAPTQNFEQNRLQRVTSSALISNPAPQITASLKPEVTSASAASAPAPVTQQPARPETTPVIAKAVEPESAPVMPRESAPAMAKAPEPARAEAAEESEVQANVNAEKIRAAEAKAAERKRSEAKKLAERRKQREIELAAVAVKRMLRDREPQQVADGFATPRFGFFGQD